MSGSFWIILEAVAIAAVGLGGWWLGKRRATAAIRTRVRRLAIDADRARSERLASLRQNGLERRRGASSDALASLVETIDSLLSELDRERRRLGGAFAELREGMVILDSAGKIQLVNPAAVDALGRAMAPGTALSEVSRQPEVLDSVRRAREASGWVSGGVYETLDGRLLEPQAGTLEDDRVALLLRDVTLEKRAETLRREFVANVSHELKTPLTAIRGYAETLGDSLDEAALGRFVERILVHCRRLEALLEDVMELARLEEEEVMRRTEKLDLDLRLLIDEAIEQVREASPGTQTHIDLDAPTAIHYRGHRDFLAQLFRNLIDNAVKYSPDGSSVEVRAADEDDGVVVTVEDNGPGISSEHLPHLFERFYRVDSGRARSSGGTGLGLAIVKHVTRTHGGTVKVDSRLGHGTRFTVHLPR